MPFIHCFVDSLDHQLTPPDTIEKGMQYGVLVNVPMASTKANCNVSGFYQRVAQWKVRQQNNSKPAANTVINVAAKSLAVLLILTTLLSSSLDQQQGMLIDPIPVWCDKKKNKTTLFKRKQLSGSQA